MTKTERVKNWNNNFYRWNAFNENTGKTYIVIGNTYEIKDELKKKGAKFSRELGWHFANPVDGYELYELDIEDVIIRTDSGQIILEYEKAESLVKDVQKKLTVVEPTNSEYIGNIGDKYNNVIKLVRVYKFNGSFGYTGIFTFKDECDNTIVWITDANKNLEECNYYMIKGKIKDHREFRGDKQTIISRCKFIKVEE